MDYCYRKIFPKEFNCVIIGIYNSTLIHEQDGVWRELLSFFRQLGDANFLLIGDFNQVRKESDRLPPLANGLGMQQFNDFVSNANLLEMVLHGSRFTWQNRKSCSYIDRAFVSSGWVYKFPFLNLMTLPRGPSDHHPLWLSSVRENHGPLPFRTLDCWWDFFGFRKIIKK